MKKASPFSHTSLSCPLSQLLLYCKDELALSTILEPSGNDIFFISPYVVVNFSWGWSINKNKLTVDTSNPIKIEEGNDFEVYIDDNKKFLPTRK